jgi:hypothetical protein
MVRGERVDRVPLVLEGLQARSPSDLADPGRREIAERIGHEMHYDHIVLPETNRYLLTDPRHITPIEHRVDGSDETTVLRIATPRGDLIAIEGRNAVSETTWQVKYPVESREDIDAICSCDWQVPQAAIDAGNQTYPTDERRVNTIRLASPFVCVAAMMSYEMYLELCITDLPLIERLTAMCTERTLAILDAALASGTVDYVWMGGCEWLTPPMGSPYLYDTLVQPSERAVIERIHRAGAIAHVHCHGNIRTTLEHIIARGGDFTEPVEPPPDGDITFADAKALAAGRIALGGNVEARLMENEDADAVERAARAAFEGGRERMVFQTTAFPIQPVRGQLLANYHRLVDVWEELSPIR